ncbi:hypothetical protein A2U01_0018313, partial [Trifolium medium]|nr:hypothetical protein [Trifolium medium]
MSSICDKKRQVRHLSVLTLLAYGAGCIPMGLAVVTRWTRQLVQCPVPANYCCVRRVCYMRYTAQSSHVEEPEVTSMLDEGKKDDEEEEEKKEKEGLSGDNQSEDRPVGLGHDETTIVKPSGETLVVGEVQVLRDVAEGQSVPAAGLATTDEVAAEGNQASIIAPFLKRKEQLKAKLYRRQKLISLLKPFMSQVYQQSKKKNRYLKCPRLSALKERRKNVVNLLEGVLDSVSRV